MFYEDFNGQFCFDVSPPRKLEAIKTIMLTEHYFQNRDRAEGRKAIKKLRKDSVRVFPVQVHNDRVGVEGDFGAPSKGLDFFPVLLQPQRYFRYEPVEYTGSSKTHYPQLQSLARHFKRQNYGYFKDGSVRGNVNSLLFTNGGITGAFSLVIEDLITYFESMQRQKRDYGMDRPGAVLLPVPTYGLFMDKLERELAGKNIGIVRVRRNDNGGVNMTSLYHKIHECRDNNVQIIAYFDSNPNNPTGYIRGETETRDIAALLNAESERYIDDHLDFTTEKYNDGFQQRTQDTIVIIDDMAYEDLQYNPRRKPFSFAQLPDETFERTVVLKGISKIGMPGARIGLLMADSNYADTLTNAQLYREFTANSMGVDVMTGRYGGTSAQRRLFSRHYQELRDLHRYKSGFIDAVFNGLDHADTLSGVQKKKIVRDYAAHAGIDQKTARRILNEGLPSLHLSPGPESGFFRLFHCDALRDKTIAVKYDTQYYPYYTAIEDSHHLHWVMRAFGIHAVSGSRQGHHDENMSMRITLSLPDADLFRLHDQLKEMHRYFFGDKPEVQFDLFRAVHAGPR